MDTKLHLNPYKFRLWLDSLGGDILNARQKGLLLWLLAWGKKGCDSYNYRIAKEMKCSVRTVQRDLRRLERYYLIDIRGALGKHRRIIVIPYPDKRGWTRYFFVTSCQNMGDRLVTHQRRLKVKPLNSRHLRGETPQERVDKRVADNLKRAAEQRQRLLYETSAKAESAKTADRVLPQGETPRTPPAVQGKEGRILKMLRRDYIERFIRLGWPRQRAISIAEARMNQLAERHKNKSAQRQ